MLEGGGCAAGGGSRWHAQGSESSGVRTVHAARTQEEGPRRASGLDTGIWGWREDRKAVRLHL